MKTKDKILDVAQDLFNKNGIRKVSVRSLVFRMASHEKKAIAKTETSIVMGCLSADIISFITLFQLFCK